MNTKRGLKSLTRLTKWIDVITHQLNRIMYSRAKSAVQYNITMQSYGTYCIWHAYHLTSAEVWTLTLCHYFCLKKYVFLFLLGNRTRLSNPQSEIILCIPVTAAAILCHISIRWMERNRTKLKKVWKWSILIDWPCDFHVDKCNYYHIIMILNYVIWRAIHRIKIYHINMTRAPDQLNPTIVPFERSWNR